MGKSLIIKGADFSQNGMPAPQYYFPNDIEENVLNISAFSQSSQTSWGSYGTNPTLLGENYVGMVLTGLKIHVHTTGVISLYEVGLTSANPKRVLFERLTFENTGWQTVRFSKPFIIEDSMLVVHNKDSNTDEPKDTANFSWGDSSSIPDAYVDRSKFSSCNIVDKYLEQMNTAAAMLFCFECLR